MFQVTLSQYHLLVDTIRNDFLALEEKLWKFVLWETSYYNRKDVEVYLVKHFHTFDENLKQVKSSLYQNIGTKKKAFSVDNFPILHLGI